MGAAWIQNIWWRGIWLNSVKGSHWGMPTSCKVCIELPRAPLMHSLASHTWFGRSDITGGNAAVWILTTASEESINHRPWRISTITTPANQKIKRDSQFVQICWLRPHIGPWEENCCHHYVEKFPWKTRQKYFGACRRIQMDVMDSDDTDLQNAGGRKIKHLL